MHTKTCTSNYGGRGGGGVCKPCIGDTLHTNTSAWEINCIKPWQAHKIRFN